MITTSPAEPRVQPSPLPPALATAGLLSSWFLEAALRADDAPSLLGLLDNRLHELDQVAASTRSAMRQAVADVDRVARDLERLEAERATAESTEGAAFASQAAQWARLALAWFDGQRRVLVQVEALSSELESLRPVFARAAAAQAHAAPASRSQAWAAVRDLLRGGLAGERGIVGLLERDLGRDVAIAPEQARPAVAARGRVRLVELMRGRVMPAGSARATGAPPVPRVPLLRRRACGRRTWTRRARRHQARAPSADAGDDAGAPPPHPHPPPAVGRSGACGDPRRGVGSSDYCTVERAAELLGMTADALRARCRRAARKVGRDVVATLGLGILGIKLGRSWRIQFPTGEPRASLALGSARSGAIGGSDGS